MDDRDTVTIPKVQVRHVPMDLWRAARSCAARHGQTVRQFVIDALRAHLDRKETP